MFQMPYSQYNIAYMKGETINNKLIGSLTNKNVFDLLTVIIVKIKFKHVIYDKWYNLIGRYVFGNISL